VPPTVRDIMDRDPPAVQPSDSTQVGAKAPEPMTADPVTIEPDALTAD
jgi:hypothetical protein